MIGRWFVLMRSRMSCGSWSSRCCPPEQACGAVRLPITAGWLLRHGAVGAVFGGGEADQLPARGALGQRARQAAAAGHVRTITGFRTASIHRDEVGRLVLESFGGHRLEAVDEVVALTGMRSYGRAPTFLAMTGYEQVRSVVAALAGDREGAAPPGRTRIAYLGGRELPRLTRPVQDSLVVIDGSQK